MRRIVRIGAALAAVAGGVMLTAAALPAGSGNSGVTVWSATSKTVTVTSTVEGQGNEQEFAIPQLPGASFTQTPGQVMLLTAHITSTLVDAPASDYFCDVGVYVVATGSGQSDGVKVYDLAQRGDVGISTSSLAFPAPESASHPSLQLSGRIQNPGNPACLGQTYRVSVRVSVAMLGK